MTLSGKEEAAIFRRWNRATVGQTETILNLLIIKIIQRITEQRKCRDEFVFEKRDSAARIDVDPSNEATLTSLRKI